MDGFRLLIAFHSMPLLIFGTSDQDALHLFGIQVNSIQNIEDFKFIL